jgi:hypothetical protein
LTIAVLEEFENDLHPVDWALNPSKDMIGKTETDCSLQVCKRKVYYEKTVTVDHYIIRSRISPLWLFRLPAKLIKRRSEMGGSQDKDT